MDDFIIDINKRSASCSRGTKGEKTNVNGLFVRVEENENVAFSCGVHGQKSDLQHR